MSGHTCGPSRAARSCVIFMLLATTPSLAGVSKLYPPFSDQTAALRLAQVMAIATRQQIVESGVHYQSLLDSGIPDAELHDGSLAIGRINCCGGEHDLDMALWFHVPDSLHVELGDIVEIKMGRQAKKADKGSVNVALRVREKHGVENSACRWDPPNERLWGRILVCDWMEAEGWTRTKGMNKTWLKRAAEGEGK